MSNIAPVNTSVNGSVDCQSNLNATSVYKNQNEFSTDLNSTLADLSQRGLISASDANTVAGSQLSFTDPNSLLMMSMLKTASSMQLEVTLNFDKVSKSIVEKMKSAAQDRLNGAIGSFAISMAVSLAGIPMGLAAGKQMSAYTMENSNLKQPLDTSNFSALFMNMGTQFGQSGGQIFSAQEEVSATGDDAQTRILGSIMDQLSQLSPYNSAKQSLN